MTGQFAQADSQSLTLRIGIARAILVAQCQAESSESRWDSLTRIVEKVLSTEGTIVCQKQKNPNPEIRA